MRSSLPRISHHLRTEAGNKLANTSWRSLAALNVLSDYVSLIKSGRYREVVMAGVPAKLDRALAGAALLGILARS